jgi:nitrogen fixation/metabolism regulation signal transduction histidine kinase
MVLEAAVNLLTNPVFLRFVVVLSAGGFSFALGTMLIRRMRRSIMDDSLPTASQTSPDAMPLFTYQTVIQELKRQKYELENLQSAERRRAKTSENISAAVLANLSSGVLFITPNGLVRQANHSAKQILGFASPIGMSVGDIFRDAAAIPKFETTPSAAIILEQSLRENSPFRQLDVRYTTPSGEDRVLNITATSIKAASGDLLGAACLINDQTEIAEIRRQQELRGEISGEMALELRNSLTTIADCARRLAESNREDADKQLAADIASEAEHLQKNIGGFLTRSNAAGAAAGI